MPACAGLLGVRVVQLRDVLGPVLHPGSGLRDELPASCVRAAAPSRDWGTVRGYGTRCRPYRGCCSTYYHAGIVHCPHLAMLWEGGPSPRAVSHIVRQCAYSSAPSCCCLTRSHTSLFPPSSFLLPAWQPCRTTLGDAYGTVGILPTSRHRDEDVEGSALLWTARVREVLAGTWMRVISSLLPVTFLATSQLWPNVRYILIANTHAHATYQCLGMAWAGPLCPNDAPSARFVAIRL